jgi:hypothetical protein
VAGDLHVYAVFEKPVRVMKNEDDQDTQCLIKVQGVPKDVGLRIFEPPFEDGAYCKVNGVPQAQYEVGPLPYSRYFIKKVHPAKIPY